jgi:hypothetical protein
VDEVQIEYALVGGIDFEKVNAVDDGVAIIAQRVAHKGTADWVGAVIVCAHLKPVA